MKYHSGEVQLQNEIGMRKQADRIANGIRDYLPPPMQAFLLRKPFSVVGGRSRDGKVWASPVSGAIEQQDENHILMINGLSPQDPLVNEWVERGYFGSVQIEFKTRRRIRINGMIRKIHKGKLTIQTNQVYVNCNQYITPREYVHKSTVRTALSPKLSLAQQRWIEQANTMFIASVHPEGGADASHRGGPPGFVRVQNEYHLQIPDYSGNMMFNTLGNILINSAIGLLFLDFETGKTLQLTGKAVLNRDPAVIKTFENAQNLIDFQIREVIESSRA